MNSSRTAGIGLGLYFGSFVIAALLGLPRLLTYTGASGLGVATVGYALYASGGRILRARLVRWQLLTAVFLGLLGVSYVVNRGSYDAAMTIKVVGYGSLMLIATLVALISGYPAVRACMNTYLVCLMFAMAVTVAVNNTNSNNHRLLGPTYREGVAGSGLHHNEVGLLGMTAVMLATNGGWPVVLAVTPPAVLVAVLSGSRGSLLGIVLALVTFAAVKEVLANAARRDFATIPARAVFLSAAAIGLLAVAGTVAGSFVADEILMLNSENRGLSSGFTGRWDVWHEMVAHWQQSPLVGRGYGVVRGEALALGKTADGGFLLLTAELGLAGLFLFLFLILRTLQITWRAVATEADPCAMTILVFLVTFCFINIFESRFVGTGSIGLGLFFYFASLCTLIPEPHGAAVTRPEARAICPIRIQS